MSILGPAQIRMWIEQWKEEVMSSIPANDLQQKFEEKQISKGKMPPKAREDLGSKLEGGEQIL